MTRSLMTLSAAFAATLALPALADVPRVVADMPVTASLAQMVLGDLGKVEVILPSGADAHDYQMKPSQAKALQDADLLVWIGPQMTPWLDRAADAAGKDRMLTLLEVPETFTQPYGAGPHDHDHKGEEGHDHAAEGEAGHDHAAEGEAAHDHAAEGEAGHDHAAEGEAGHDHDHAAEGEAGHDHDHEGHSHTGTDPHAFLDPHNGKLWVAAIAADLSRRDAKNAATYAANAKAAAEKIDATDAAIAADLKGLGDKSFVVFHDAYGYFTGHYGLKPALPVSLGDASKPSAAKLQELKDTAAKAGATCAFPEANHDARLLDAAIEGSGIKLGAALDPEASALPMGPALYTDMLTSLGAALAGCLKG